MTAIGCLWIVVLATVTSVVMITPSAGIRVKILYKLENVLTCYTCPEKTNNTECNKWAPDVFCPYKHTVCKTVHSFNKETGESTSVEKTCALPEQCSIDMLGCKQTGNGAEQECISCCSDSYCNKAVPTNTISSIQLSDTVILNTARPAIQSTYTLIIVLICSILHRLLS